MKPYRLVLTILLSACVTPEAPEEAPISARADAAPAPARPGQAGAVPPPPQHRPAGPVETPPGELEPVGEAAASPRSILLISWDTVRADHLSLYGGRAEVPNLEALADAGVRFDQAISHFPETAISHWSLLTGVEPAAHGDVPGAGGSRYRGPTLAEIAGASGYATAAFVGGETLTAAASGLHRGFDRYDDRHDWQRTDLKRPGAEVAGRAAAWIREQEGPWFAFVHFFDAHAPYQPPEPWDRRYDPDYQGSMDGSEGSLRPYRDEGRPISEADRAHAVALYDGEISYLDSLLPALLEAAGPDAVVALTADHGESFEHGYLFNHRASLWDSTLRVPLVVRGPGTPAGAAVADQVALTDVAPTLLELAGLPGERKMQGRSLAGLAAGSGGGRPLVFSLTDPVMPAPQVAARSLAGKVIWQEDGRVLGYDLAADPLEVTDLGGPPPGLGVSWADYQAHTEQATPLMREPLPRRHSEPGEAERLQLLGYQDRPPQPR